MKYLPGHFEDYARFCNWTHGEKISLIAVNYLDIATYGFLVVLAVRNIWVILFQ